MNPYKDYATNSEAEKDGIYLEEDFFRIRLARAGGGNKAYQRAMEECSRPYRRAIQKGVLSADKANELLLEVFSKAVIRSWEVKDEEGNWVPGIHDLNGEVQQPTQENIRKVLSQIPDLWDYVQRQANNQSLFLADTEEFDLGN